MSNSINFLQEIFIVGQDKEERIQPRKESDIVNNDISVREKIGNLFL